MVLKSVFEFLGDLSVCAVGSLDVLCRVRHALTHFLLSFKDCRKVRVADLVRFLDSANIQYCRFQAVGERDVPMSLFSKGGDRGDICLRGRLWALS